VETQSSSEFAFVPNAVQNEKLLEAKAVSIHGYQLEEIISPNRRWNLLWRGRNTATNSQQIINVM
jgi:hypothetical protein